MPEAPASHVDLLERPTFAHLATVRPDGSPQSSVMWFAWDGSRIRLTHTSTRQKFANLSREPRVALSIADPDDQYRFLEIRGTVEEIAEDPGAEFYRSLRTRSSADVDRRDRETWRMPPLNMLSRPVMSSGRKVALTILRSYLAIAMVLVIVRIVQMALAH